MRHRTFRSRARHEGGLTGTQRSILLALPIFPDDGAGFASEREARAAWRENRDILMREFVAEFPGERPYAFWAFDQDHPDAHSLPWWAQYEALDRLGLLSADEQVRWQKRHIRPPEDICDPEATGAIVAACAKRYDPYIGDRFRQEEEFLARFHEARDEEKLGRFYRAVVAGIEG